MTARREALKMILAAGALPVAGIALRPDPKQVEPMTPFQLHVDGTGWCRDRDGRTHPLTLGLMWVNKLTDLRVDGRKVDGAVEFNLEDGWVRCYDISSEPGVNGFREYLLHGKVTVEWYRG